MRLHFSESMGCTRKAVDASLTAYELLLHPEKLELHFKRAWHFQHIKRIIQRARKADPTRYPFAAGLLELHDMGSQYGSHADVSTMIYRMKMSPLENGHRIQNFAYFQMPESKLQGDSHFVNLFHRFLAMTRLFDEFTAKYAPIDFQAWKADRDRNMHACAQVGMALLVKCKGAGGRRPVSFAWRSFIPLR